MEKPEGMEVINFKGKTYFVTEESYEKLYLYTFDLHHADVPDPCTEHRFMDLLSECQWDAINGR